MAMEGVLYPDPSPCTGLNPDFRLIPGNMQYTVAIALRNCLCFEEKSAKPSLGAQCIVCLLYWVRSA
ncbi:hypothetical protein IG631_04737 [Alternaria alternata]|nr:hypothetical protein IG631_04737 [Alternaria alternata]